MFFLIDNLLVVTCRYFLACIVFLQNVFCPDVTIMDDWMLNDQLSVCLSLLQSLVEIASRDKQIGFSCIPTLMQPNSRGSIRLQSTNSSDHPLIDPNYFHKAEDLEVMLQGEWHVLVLRCCSFLTKRRSRLKFVLLILQPCLFPGHHTHAHVYVYMTHTHMHAHTHK